MSGTSLADRYLPTRGTISRAARPTGTLRALRAYAPQTNAKVSREIIKTVLDINIMSEESMRRARVCEGENERERFARLIKRPYIYGTIETGHYAARVSSQLCTVMHPSGRILNGG